MIGRENHAYHTDHIEITVLTISVLGDFCLKYAIANMIRFERLCNAEPFFVPIAQPFVAIRQF